MPRQLPISEPTASVSTFDGPVPEEHTSASDRDHSPGDWSHLGRRVLAEAWRQLTAEYASRKSVAAAVVPAPDSAEVEP